jgi:outer membrane translocation and assembly module TamA
LLPERPVLREQPDVDYLGAFFTYTLQNVDKVSEPRRGIRFEVTAETLNEVNSHADVQGINADLRTYVPMEIGRFRSVIATRVALERRMDDIDPLTAVNLGGKEAMRGLRRGRFSGNTVAYGNFELRGDLLTSRNKVLPFRLGFIGLADAGRVWVDAVPDAPRWHHAFGGGLFISPLDMVVLQGTYAVSDDDALVDIRLGFFF